MRNINQDTIQKTIEHYGKRTQSIVCMEECSELIQCISKELRGKTNIDHLAEEMADVCICIEILKQIYGVTDEQMQTWIDFKQKREEERIARKD